MIKTTRLDQTCSSLTGRCKCASNGHTLRRIHTGTRCFAKTSYLHSLDNISELLHERWSHSCVDQHSRWLPHLALCVCIGERVGGGGMCVCVCVCVCVDET